LEPENDSQLKYLKNNSIPKVSIGIPVYNGEKYIHQAIDSVLAQKYSDFELVIPDNASTDGTVRRYAGTIVKKIFESNM
jgi:glycosyltransferase involved in cell wall biosynthesis